MATSINDQLALFNQYDNEYCNKATDVARKIQAVGSLSGGADSNTTIRRVRLLLGPVFATDVWVDSEYAACRDAQGKDTRSRLGPPRS